MKRLLIFLIFFGWPSFGSQIQSSGFQAQTGSAAPAAGTLGESVRVASTTFTNTAATTAWADMANVSLTAGHWLCFLQAQISLNAATMTEFAVGISTSTGNAFADIAEGDNMYESAAMPTGTIHQGAVVSGYQIFLSATTTYYAKVRATFSAGNPQYVYRLQCNRIS